jgi:hypothetical protein
MDDEDTQEHQYIVVNGKLVENEDAEKNFALEFDEAGA